MEGKRRDSQADLIERLTKELEEAEKAMDELLARIDMNADEISRIAFERALTRCRRCDGVGEVVGLGDDGNLRIIRCPQCSASHAGKWVGSNPIQTSEGRGIAETLAVEYLKKRGWGLTSDFEWMRPWIGYKPDENELRAINFLIDEWDC